VVWWPVGIRCGCMRLGVHPRPPVVSWFCVCLGGEGGRKGGIFFLVLHRAGRAVCPHAQEFSSPWYTSPWYDVALAKSEARIFLGKNNN